MRNGTDQNFQLDPQLAHDTLFVGDLSLCRLLLMNDARFPWLVLVPRRVGVTEVWELSQEDQCLLMSEVAVCAQKLKYLAGATKINIGALGNIVRQLHVHVVARSLEDTAWPKPVWSYGGSMRYAPENGDVWMRVLQEGLKDVLSRDT